MSNLYEDLKNKKLHLLNKRKELASAIDRCALPGYITAKNIRGKKTYYLQYRDAYSKMTSVHLSKEKLAFCQKSLNDKEQNEQEIEGIDNDLRLLSLVDISPEITEESGENVKNTRLLANATGISPKHKYLFYLIPRDSSGEYDIHFFTKKETQIAPMIYVNESAYDKIRDYIITAASIVDETADRLSKESPQKSTKSEQNYSLPNAGQYHTRTGIHFSYSPCGANYTVTYFYKKKKYEFEYETYTPGNEGIDRIELARMGFSVERHIRINTFSNEVQKYYARKQNVHPETQRS
jgi:hypothetical protein